ncbi:hypothetical protein [Paraflavitalea speifideaquila]|uniref:hypothetical protein n=1 Tax=Paraflavitalea speifideaquila TaxID=3076558 RepID=UPI0028E563DE|nr:hypothetical protein [Paraflavitalea speifideiaquila]
MKIVTSVSGGQTSTYLAANYPADALVFALVRIEDERCRFPDRVIIKEVEDRIQAPFIATAEDDTIIYTMLDLEQYLGKRIDWVTGPTFDWVIANRGGWLPNKLHRYCTTALKIEPMFYWWAKTYGLSQPVKMNIGFRANEIKRANKMDRKLNDDGLLEMKASFEKHPNGDNKWISVPWQRPQYPLIQDGIFKDTISRYWAGKSVRFADYNNCAGCFHRNPPFLKYQFQVQPNKMQWFREQEGGKNGFWRSDGSYAKIEKAYAQLILHADDFTSCDSGYCEIE